MTDINRLEKLAKMKAELKAMTAEVKQLEKELIEEGAPDKVKTSCGTLSKITRVNYECASKQTAHARLGTDAYVAASSLSFGAVKKATGEFQAEMFLSQGVFREKSTSVYYSLRG